MREHTLRANTLRVNPYSAPARESLGCYVNARRMPGMADRKETLGGNIRKLRQAVEPELAQLELDRRSGVPRGTIATLEANRHAEPRFSKVLKVAKGLSVSLDVLVRGIDADYDLVLMRHTPTVKGTIPFKVGDPDVAPQADARKLQERTEQLEQLYRKINDFAIELGDLARQRGLAVEKNQTAKGRKSKGR